MHQAAKKMLELRNERKSKEHLSHALAEKPHKKTKKHHAAKKHHKKAKSHKKHEKVVPAVAPVTPVE